MSYQQSAGKSRNPYFEGLEAIYRPWQTWDPQQKVFGVVIMKNQFYQWYLADENEKMFKVDPNNVLQRKLSHRYASPPNNNVDFSRIFINNVEKIFGSSYISKVYWEAYHQQLLIQFINQSRRRLWISLDQRCQKEKQSNLILYQGSLESLLNPWLLPMDQNIQRKTFSWKFLLTL